MCHLFIQDIIIVTGCSQLQLSHILGGICVDLFTRYPKFPQSQFHVSNPNVFMHVVCEGVWVPVCGVHMCV